MTGFDGQYKAGPMPGNWLEDSARRMASDYSIPIEDLMSHLRPQCRLLGLDVGSKTIGLALCDPTFTVATPLKTIARTKFTKDLIELVEVIENHNVCAIIVGLPLHLDGAEGRSAQSVRAFAANVAKAISLPIVFWDERLSTAAVERTLIEADSSRKRRAEVIDKMAAAYILQGVLERLRTLT